MNWPSGNAVFDVGNAASTINGNALRGHYGVTLYPKRLGKTLEIEVKGKLATLIGGDALPQAIHSGEYVVAGEGLEPPTPGL